MKPRLLTSSLAAVVAALALAACGGSSDNGVSSKSPTGIVSAASQAISHASSVHISGSIVTNGTPITLDLHIVSGKGATGSLSSKGVSFQLVNIGQVVYIKAGASFWQSFANPAVAQLLNGRWFKTTATGNFASLAKFTSLRTLFSQSIANHGPLTKGATTTVNGQNVVAVRDTARGGTLFVATTGQPYPVEIRKIGASAGAIRFDQYNQPVTLNAPANAIDASKLGL